MDISREVRGQDQLVRLHYGVFFRDIWQDVYFLKWGLEHWDSIEAECLLINSYGKMLDAFILNSNHMIGSHEWSRSLWGDSDLYEITFQGNPGRQNT